MSLATPEEVMKHIDQNYFPNICVLWLLFLLLLVKVKPLKNTMGQEHLNGLVLMYCYRSITLNPSDVIKQYSIQQPC